MPRKNQYIGGIIGADPLVPTDEHWDDVTLLLDGSNPTDDLSNNASITNVGSVASSSMTGPTGYGTVDALSFNGTDQRLTTSYYTASLFNQDFTIEGWFNLDASQTHDYPALFSFRQTPSSYSGGVGVILYINEYDNSSKLYLAAGAGNASPYWIFNVNTDETYTDGWQHLAVTRSGNTYRVFKDGTEIGSYTDSNSTSVVAEGAFTLMSGVSNGGDHAGGDVFDFRITEGIARDIAADWTAGVYNSALPTTADPIRPGVSNLGALGGDGASTTRPTRRWGGITGRSLVNNNLPTTGVLSLPEMLQVRYGASTGGIESTINVGGQNYRVHTFNSSGTFTVRAPLTDVEYLIIGGGGGGGVNSGGGGGAGGYRSSVVGESSGGGASPETRLVLSAGSYAVTVGAGGAGGSGNGDDGSDGGDSIFAGITSTGGGGGGAWNVGTGAGRTGGSGGGGGGNDASGSGGSATSPTQGYGGGSGVGSPTGTWSPAWGGGGGGGAGAAGSNGSSSAGGAGGNGLSSSITGSSVTRGGGGGGGAYPDTSELSGAGGSGGGGAGGIGTTTPQYVGQAGTANTGGGGGGSRGGTSGNGGDGGSGVVIIRYKI